MARPSGSRTTALRPQVESLDGEPLISRCLRHRLATRRVDNALKDQAAIGAAEERFTGAFRVRHQGANVPAFVANPRDVPQRTIGIRRVCYFALSVAVLPKDLVV